MIELIALVIIVALLEYYHYTEAKAWQEERSNLLDRIQARDLPEFKAFQVPEPAEEAPKKQEDEIIPV